MARLQDQHADGHDIVSVETMILSMESIRTAVMLLNIRMAIVILTKTTIVGGAAAPHWRGVITPLIYKNLVWSVYSITRFEGSVMQMGSISSHSLIREADTPHRHDDPLDQEDAVLMTTMDISLFLTRNILYRTLRTCSQGRRASRGSSRA